MRLYVNDVGSPGRPELRHYTFDVPKFHTYGDYLQRADVQSSLERVIMPVAIKEIESIDYVTKLAEAYDGQVVDLKDWYQVVFPPSKRESLRDILNHDNFRFI